MEPNQQMVHARRSTIIFSMVEVVTHLLYLGGDFQKLKTYLVLQAFTLRMLNFKVLLQHL